MTVVSDDNIPFTRRFSNLFCLFETVNSQVDKAAVVPDGYILVEESGVELDKVDSGLENRLEEFLGENHGWIEVETIDDSLWADFV